MIGAFRRARERTAAAALQAKAPPQVAEEKATEAVHVDTPRIVVQPEPSRQEQQRRR